MSVRVQGGDWRGISTAVQVTTSATLLAAANPKRVGLILRNSAGTTVFLGASGVTTTLYAASIGLTTANYQLSGPLCPVGALYGIVSAATANVYVQEIIAP